MTDISLVKDVRELTAEDLDIGYKNRAAQSHGSSAPDAPVLRDDDPRLKTIIGLLSRFGGVILSGPPGTGKSWLAGQVADSITHGDNSRRADIQFHASYQFEDFMEGYRPKRDGSGFELRDGVFLHLVQTAIDRPNEEFVIVIDELSRADVGRVFGEALTYIERSKRGQEFELPSGRLISIPLNLVVIATMNQLDRGVDGVDVAFERRFAKVEMPPNRRTLVEILDGNGFGDSDIKRRLLGWFDRMNSRAVQTPAAAIGHAYFSDVVDAETLQDVWEYQLKYHVRRAFRYDQPTLNEMVSGWMDIFGSAATREPIDSVGETGITKPGPSEE